MAGPSLVISATFTADAVAQTLEFWMRELGFDVGSVERAVSYDYASGPEDYQAILERRPAPAISRLKEMLVKPDPAIFDAVAALLPPTWDIRLVDRNVEKLRDDDLRTLVGRLCEAELRQRCLPLTALTYGGDQDARDGGIERHGGYVSSR